MRKLGRAASVLTLLYEHDRIPVVEPAPAMDHYGLQFVPEIISTPDRERTLK